MNIYQRIAIAVGAVVLAVVLWTTPKVWVTEKGILRDRQTSPDFAPVPDIRTALVRGVSVVALSGGVVLLLGLAKKRRGV